MSDKETFTREEATGEWVMTEMRGVIEKIADEAVTAAMEVLNKHDVTTDDKSLDSLRDHITDSISLNLEL